MEVLKQARIKRGRSEREMRGGGGVETEGKRGKRNSAVLWVTLGLLLTLPHVHVHADSKSVHEGPGGSNVLKLLSGRV